MLSTRQISCEVNHLNGSTKPNPFIKESHLILGFNFSLAVVDIPLCFV